MLEEGKICTLAGTDCVLVEFSPMDESRYIRNSLSELQNMGYEPIIAHVERYMSLTKDINKIKELRDMGIHIQVNAASIMGGFGKPTKALAEKLLKNQLSSILTSVGVILTTLPLTSVFFGYVSLI
jgi:protein-tyrosine phosphatase